MWWNIRSDIRKSSMKRILGDFRQKGSQFSGPLDFITLPVDMRRLLSVRTLIACLDMFDSLSLYWSSVLI